MVRIHNKFVKYLFLFLVGGFAYCFIEIMARGYSHISMLVAGGVCFVCIGLLNENKKYSMSFLSQMVISAGIITGVEFITGIIVNRMMGLHVWDYSEKPYNILGQCCLLYVVIWFFLSPVAIVADDYLRYWFMGGKRPKYKLL